MAQDTSGAARGTVTTIIPGEMAARIDRLPMSWMVWEIALLVQVGWATSASTDGIARTLYPFIWLPAHEISSFEYSVLYAMQAGISILIGGYTIGWLSDKIGRRKALVGSAALAGLFIWPFAYVTNFWALFFLSIADTLGFAGFLAINVVYLTEMTGPRVRGRLIMGAQALAIFVLYVVLLGLVPHYMIPTSYRPYLWLLAGLNIAVAVFLYFRMPESPRWLEARGRRDEARQVMERLEARVMKRHPVLPEPDLAPYEVVAEEKTSMFVVFGKQYLWTTILLLVVMAMGYAGIVYGGASYGFLFLSESRGYSAGFVFALTAWAGVVATVAYIINAIIGDRVERKYTQLVGAILFAGSWYLLYVTHHNTPLIVVLYIVQNIGIVLWLWSMYTYIPSNYPTRMRSLGTGWTDGMGHLGAWGGVLLCGQLFVATAPLNWILFITIPGALVPAVLIAVFGVRQRRRALEEMAR